MEVRTQTEAEAWGVVFSKYPMLFAATNTLESFLNSLRDATASMAQFGATGTPNKLLYARNLTEWIQGYAEELAALNITPERNDFISPDGVFLLIDGAETGRVSQDGTEWVATFTADTWAHGIRIGDVFDGGTVAWTDNEYSTY